MDAQPLHVAHTQTLNEATPAFYIKSATVFGDRPKGSIKMLWNRQKSGETEEILKRLKYVNAPEM